MVQNEWIEALKKLAENEDTLTVGKEISDLKIKFEDYLIDEERKDQIAQLEAEEKGENYDPKDFKALKENFYTIYNLYREQRQQLIQEKKNKEAANLQEKKRLIERLKELISSEENIGAAYNNYKEIHEAWKKVGDIARDKRDEIQSEYSRLLEEFFYNMKIYRELKEHDLKRNFQLKMDIIQQLQDLAKLDSIKEIESGLKHLQNEWEEIGPVMNEEWEALKEKYWNQVKSLYDRIRQFYNDRKSILLENLERKKELLLEAEKLISETAENTSAQLWDKATEQILSIQEKWKTIGFGPKKENEEVWQKLRVLSDEFFEKKKAFYAVIQDKYAGIAAKKKEIIEKANALKDSTDWKDTATKLVQLQKDWKKLGFAGQKLEQRLWSEFRGACDAFFNARQKHFEDQDKQLETNLIAKQAIIQNIESYTLSDDKKTVLNDLREFTNTFNAAGKVPMKDRDTIYSAYKAAIDKHYQQLKLEGDEKDKIMFEAKIQTMSSSPESGRLLSKERAALRQQIETLKNDILQYENNLGFFARSKGADALRKEVEAKINTSKSKIESLKKRLKLIPNE